MYYLYIYMYMIHLPAMTAASRSRNESSSRRLAATLRTTLGSFLCSALRDELEVDCVLFDGGNIRGADLAWDRPQCVRPVQMMYIKYVIHIYIG